MFEVESEHLDHDASYQLPIATKTLLQTTLVALRDAPPCYHCHLLGPSKHWAALQSLAHPYPHHLGWLESRVAVCLVHQHTLTTPLSFPSRNPHILPTL